MQVRGRGHRYRRIGRVGARRLGGRRRGRVTELVLSAAEIIKRAGRHLQIF